MSKICRACNRSGVPFSYCEGTPDGLQYDCQECINTKRIEASSSAATRFEQLRKADPKNYDAALRAMLCNQARIRAKRKAIEHTIKPADIELVHVCPIRNVPLERATGKFSQNSYTLDRIDNTKGYIPGNVRVISWLANNLKNNFTIEDVERLLKYMKGE